MLLGMITIANGADYIVGGETAEENEIKWQVYDNELILKKNFFRALFQLVYTILRTWSGTPPRN
jgi:hypothetical protein